jgi:putative transposase
LAERGIVVTYETVRQWCLKFGRNYANELRRRRPRCGDKWYRGRGSSSASVERGTISGDPWIKMAMCSTCGSQSHCNKKAAKRFFRKLLKGLQYVPRVIITDKLKSYGAAKREILPSVEHRQHKGLNNRAENSHQPTQLREKKMRRFRISTTSPTLSALAFEPIARHFQPRRHLLSAGEYRAILQDRFLVWNEVTTAQMVA